MVNNTRKVLYKIQSIQSIYISTSTCTRHKQHISNQCQTCVQFLLKVVFVFATCGQRDQLKQDQQTVTFLHTFPRYASIFQNKTPFLSYDVMLTLTDFHCQLSDPLSISLFVGLATWNTYDIILSITALALPSSEHDIRGKWLTCEYIGLSQLMQQEHINCSCCIKTARTLEKT